MKEKLSKFSARFNWYALSFGAYVFMSAFAIWFQSLSASAAVKLYNQMIVVSLMSVAVMIGGVAVAIVLKPDMPTVARMLSIPAVFVAVIGVLSLLMAHSTFSFQQFNTLPIGQMTCEAGRFCKQTVGYGGAAAGFGLGAAGYAIDHQKHHKWIQNCAVGTAALGSFTGFMTFLGNTTQCAIT